MNLDQLNYLLVLAEEQNMTRASQRLFITQPTLTTFVTKLERELGTRLFDRSKNPIRLTTNGKIYIKKMQELVLVEQQLKEELKYNDSEKKRIRIGLGYAHSIMWSCTIAKNLLDMFPELDIQFREGQEADLISALRNEEIDLLLGHAEIDPVNFHFEVLFNERIVLLVPREFVPLKEELLKDNSLFNPLMIPVDYIEDKRMIIPGNSMGLSLNMNLLKEQYRLMPCATIQTCNIFTAAEMIANGLGYMLGNNELTRLLTQQARAKILYCVLPDMPTSRKYYFGYAEKNPNLLIIKEVVRILRQVVKEGC